MDRNTSWGQGLEDNQSEVGKVSQHPLLSSEMLASGLADCSFLGRHLKVFGFLSAYRWCG